MIDTTLNKTINVIHIEAPIEKVWRAIATTEGSNSYLSDSAESTGDPDHPIKGDQFHFIYGDIENHSKCLESDFPTFFRLQDEYKSMLPDGTIVPYKLDTKFYLKQLVNMVELTVDVKGYGKEPHDLWIRECMETGWRRSLLNLKCVLELGLDLRNELFGYPRIGITNTGVSEHYANKYGVELGVGNYILECFPKGPAHNAGIRKGDVVTKISGVPVNTYSEFVVALSQHYNKSQEVDVEYVRHKKRYKTKIKPTYEDRFTGLIDPESKSSDLVKIREERQKTRLS